MSRDANCWGLIYPPKAKSIFTHSSAPAAKPEEDSSTLETPVHGARAPPPPAQTGQAQGSPDCPPSLPKQWLYKLHRLASNRHRVPCCPRAQTPGARMCPGQDALMQL